MGRGRPDDRELDDEIRGHIALSVKDRIERGEHPDAARRAAWLEFGYVPKLRESMHGVWYSRWFDAVMALVQEMRVGFRSLLRTKGLAATVIVTLALGIGANAAIFSVVRGVLLRPLVNRGEDRLVYIRQLAPGAGIPNRRFSIPEIDDFKARVKTIAAFGDFSTIDFSLVGLGEPRIVKAGVVSGSYFDVMGLRPALGRLLDARDDGPNAAGAAVLTHRFWSTTLKSDPAVVNKTIRLDGKHATIVGVLEPSIPYPATTEIIANVVTSAHHLSAVMNLNRNHRMTELFGRLAPGATLEDARADLAAAFTSLTREHPDAYPAGENDQLNVTLLRNQIVQPARTILIVLLLAAGVVFVIACSNVANLILARSVRRESELSVRAALGASKGALRRTLLAESLVLCGAGALLGVALARPFVFVVARYASRFSVRALDVTIDPSVLWIGAGLAMVASIVLAYIPRLPASSGTDIAVKGGTKVPPYVRPEISGVRLTPGTNRRLRMFAMTQIACSFVLLAGAGALLAAFAAMQNAPAGFETRQVLAVDVPLPLESTPQATAFFQEATRRIGQLPGVERVAAGGVVPWRDAGSLLPIFAFGSDPSARLSEDMPRARLRMVSPGFFATLGIPLIAGRDFRDDDRRDSDQVVIVSASVADRLSPNTTAINKPFVWIDPLFGKPTARRIVGIVPDVDDQNVVPQPSMTVYHPIAQLEYGSRIFVHAKNNPYTLVPAVKRIIREMSADQPVEHAATLRDVRAEVLTPERLKAFVVSGFAGVALLIAVVGVAGVLAFSVSARTREFGVRLAIGATPRQLLLRVLSEGISIVSIGLVIGAAVGLAVARIATSFFDRVELPGAIPIVAAATVLVGAALLAALLPATKASRVDVLQALRAE